MLEILLLAGGGLWKNPVAMVAPGVEFLLPAGGVLRQNPGATGSYVAVGCDNFGPAQNPPSCLWVKCGV